MFNKELKEKIRYLEDQFSTLMAINRNTISFQSNQIQINKNFMKSDDTQIKINRNTLNALDALNQKVQELTVKVEILEKRLDEAESPNADSLEDELDRNGGTISDD